MPEPSGDLPSEGTPDGALTSDAINDAFDYQYTPAQRMAFVELFFGYWDRVRQGLARRGIELTRDDHLILQAVFIENSQNKPSTLAAIVARTHIPRATVHRKVIALAHNAFLVQHPRARTKEHDIWLSEDLALDGAMFVDMALHDFAVSIGKIIENPEPDRSKRKYAPFGPPGSQVVRRVPSRVRA